VIHGFDVSQELVDRCDVEPLVALFEELETDPDRVRTFQGTLALRFPEQESRRVSTFLDPAVQAWGEAALARVPHLLYYLNPEGAPLGIVLDPVATVGRMQATSKGEADEEAFQLLLPPLSERLIAAAQFAERMAEDWRPIIAELLDGLSPELSKAATESVEAALAV
jgi:hypothetical protein